ncbi:BTB/POZ and MATH domain-containing protein 2 [Rhynchospora pubera]|uniref:BTB/POZ and MATH domain-containing protein 2 n=1 Tax=Rhynchospora pubera TaxID=906938 RepID=A0AAV8FB40_9POAL|nr:BTB/POZ and MATH domain-containing protein 2 [Rhynchospora pubera]
MADNGKVEMDVICRMETHTKTYCGKFEGYSLIKTLPQKTYIEIGVFHMAGVFWGIHFYPNGIQDAYLTLALKLLTETSRALVTKFEIILLDQKGDKGAKKSGNYSFSKQGDICLSHSLLMQPEKKIIVPLSDLHQHFGELLESGEGADVTFEVDKEAFRAYRNVLAARSPVFKAQLFGSMMESKMDKITIEGMKADVFKIMLQYIYTDMLPSEVEVSSEMAQHLLAAADRYGLERLKVICEAKLCDSLDVETAATTLVLADQHNCGQLKGVCIDFVSSCDMLDAVMETDGFKYLMSCSPLLLKDLLDKVHNSRKSN